MALLSASSFSTQVAPLYVNGSPVALPTHATDPVTLPMSNGSSQTVFDSLTTALKCLEYMKESNVWRVMASNNVMVISVCHHKLLILENTLQNARLVQQFGAPLYIGGLVLFAARTSYDLHSQESALGTIGSLMTSSLPDNASLASAHIQVVGWNYQANSTAGQGSLMSDAVLSTTSMCRR